MYLFSSMKKQRHFLSSGHGLQSIERGLDPDTRNYVNPRIKKYFIYTKMSVFRDAAPYSLLNVYRRFRSTCEQWVAIRHCYSEDKHVYSRRSKKLKSSWYAAHSIRHNSSALTRLLPLWMVGESPVGIPNTGIPRTNNFLLSYFGVQKSM